ncbi:MAG TPA: DUF58 domain-containing protein [Candidatus Lustribacter sp.]|nr:DUF58 domain-containing protein [Candidatus Lustribacter sp.]
MDPTTGLTPERVLRRLEWHVLRRLDGRLQGDYRTLLRGIGVDFLDLREYEPGDDMRHIDWNVTARMDTPYVRQYVEDRELTAWLLLDRSPSMGFGPVTRRKDAVLTELAGTLAALLVRGGNRVGAILYDNRVELTLPPRQGRAQVLLLLRELLREPTPSGTPTDLTGLLTTANGMLRHRSLVVLVSDFISLPGWERPLTQLARRHDVVAIALAAPSESELPEAGVIVIEDAETGEQLLVDTSDVEFRLRMRDLAASYQDQLDQVARRAGVDLHTLSTGEDLVGALVRMSATRARRHR